MKNKLYVDIDSERNPSVMIGHPPEYNPTTPDEAKKVIYDDITSVFAALCSLILVADQSGYGKKEDFIRTAVDQLNNMLIEEPKTDFENEEPKTDNKV